MRERGLPTPPITRGREPRRGESPGVSHGDSRAASSVCARRSIACCGAAKSARARARAKQRCARHTRASTRPPAGTAPCVPRSPPPRASCFISLQRRAAPRLFSFCHGPRSLSLPAPAAMRSFVALCAAAAASARAVRGLQGAPTSKLLWVRRVPRARVSVCGRRAVSSCPARARLLVRPRRRGIFVPRARALRLLVRPRRRAPSSLTASPRPSHALARRPPFCF